MEVVQQLAVVGFNFYFPLLHVAIVPDDYVSDICNFEGWENQEKFIIVINTQKVGVGGGNYD